MMIPLKLKYVLWLLPALLLFMPGMSIKAQNAPVTSVPVTGNAVPGLITVPVTVRGFNNIGAISLTLQYDYSVLNFIQGSKNPLLPGSFYVTDNDEGDGSRRITMGWYGAGITLPDSSYIMNLQFSYISGNTLLQWVDLGGSCEYADGNYAALNDIPTEEYYINGFICGAIAAPGTISGTGTVCQGQSGENYSIEPVPNATGYTWTCPEGAVIIAGQNTNSITVEYSDTAVSGNISVYGTNTCGSGPVTEFAVTVNELPDADAGTDLSIPYGTSTYLNAGPGGNGTFSYHWSPEELLVNPDVEDPQTVILTSTTIFSVVVTNLQSNCQAGDEMIVTITGGPLSVNPVAVPSSLCQGESSQLYSNAGGGSGIYSYEWSSDFPGSPPWTSSLPNPVVFPDSSRHYYLYVYDGYTSVTGTTATFVSPRPTSSISGGDSLCGLDATTTLQVDLTGMPPWNFSYSFGSTTVFITDVQETPYLITASDPGEYIITATEDANCTGTSYGSAVVTKYPIPATPEITQDLNELTSSACCGNQWYFNDNPIPGATEKTYVATESGLYFVVVTLNGCSSSPSEAVDFLVGISENCAGSFAFYPNPAKNKLYIQSKQEIKTNPEVSIFTTSGLLAGKFNLPDGNSFSIDISSLAPGMYFLMFSGDDVRGVGKLLVR
jgi:hypothetical protein